MLGLTAGQIIAEKYRVDAVIGSGGMGVVVAATHIELDQRVAIKLLRDASSEALARFQREARLLVKLRSRHVARVFDVGALDDDTPFIVMELLDGRDLSAVLEQRGRLGVEEAVDYVLEAAEAIAEAHVLGMVHRDLKPANLFLALGPGGATTVKVLDFGVSKLIERPRSPDQTAGTLTNEGVALGSPGYMAPEQMVNARDVDHRADVYSLGAILYRLVSGQRPYRGDSLVSVLASMAVDPLSPLDTLVENLPAGFAATIASTLAQDQEGRPPTIAHLAQALAPYASRRGRASAEQVLATLNITLEPHGTTIMRPGIMPMPGHGAPSDLGSGPVIRPSLHSAPVVAKKHHDHARMALIGGALFVLVAVAIAFAKLTSRPPVTEETPVSPASVVRETAPATSAPTAIVIGASPTQDPSPTELAAPAEEATTESKAIGTRRKPHFSPARPPSSAPPSATDVPEGRL